MKGYIDTKRRESRREQDKGKREKDRKTNLLWCKAVANLLVWVVAQLPAAKESKDAVLEAKRRTRVLKEGCVRLKQNKLSFIKQNSPIAETNEK